MTEQANTSGNVATPTDSPDHTQIPANRLSHCPPKEVWMLAGIIVVVVIAIVGIIDFMGGGKPIPADLQGKWALSAHAALNGESVDMVWSFVVGKNQITTVRVDTTGPAGRFTSDLGDPSGTSVKVDGNQIVVNLGHDAKEGDLGGFALTRQGNGLKGKISDADGKTNSKAMDVSGTISPDEANAAEASPSAPAAKPNSAKQKKKQEFLKTATKMGQIDQTLAARAVEMVEDQGIVQQVGWQVVDEMMDSATRETRNAYREWRQAAINEQ